MTRERKEEMKYTRISVWKAKAVELTGNKRDITRRAKRNKVGKIQKRRNREKHEREIRGDCIGKGAIEGAIERNKGVRKTK